MSSITIGCPANSFEENPATWREWGSHFYLPNYLAILNRVYMEDVLEVLNERNDCSNAYFEAVNEGIQTVNDKILYGDGLPFEEVKFYNDMVKDFMKVLEIQLKR